MSDEQGSTRLDPDKVGLYPWNQRMEALFSDVDERTIDYAYLQPFFEQVALPLPLARECLGETLKSRPAAAESDRFIKFVKLSTLERHSRLPAYQEIEAELVDARDVGEFAVQGRLSLWGGKDDHYESPCLFVSHRWSTAT